MKKRVLSLLLCLVMALSLIPTVAFAGSGSTAITKVEVTGMQTLTPGQQCSTDNLTITATPANAYTVDRIWWYDCTAKDYPTSIKTFKAGHEYRLNVKLSPRDGYYFAYAGSNEDYTGVATINGETPLKAKAYSSSGELWLQSTDMTVTVAPIPITKVEVKGVQTPVVGQSTDTSGITITSTPANAFTVDDIYWWNPTDWTSEDTTFKAGKEYRLDLQLAPKEGYNFPFDPFNYTGVVTVNGTEVEAYSSNYTEKISISSDTFMAVEPKPITKVDIIGIKTPVVGRPVRDFMSFYPEDSICCIYDAKWFCDTDVTFLDADYVFEEDKEYSLKVYVTTSDDNYCVNLDTVLQFNHGEIDTYDAYSLDVNCLEGWTETMLPLKTIDTVNITGVKMPVAGGKVGDCLNLTPADSTYVISGIFWNCVTDEELLDANDVFEAGKEYYLGVTVAPADGYVMSEDARFLFNGGAIATDNVYTRVNMDGTLSGFTVDLPVTNGPAAPAVTLSNDAATGKVVVNWKAVSGAAKYEVYRATSKTGTYSKILTTTGLTCLNKLNATPGKIYYYKVRALDANGVAGEYSAPQYRCVDCAQPVITVTPNNTAKTITIKWNAVEGATKYEVYRATSKTGTYSKILTTTALTCTNKTNVVPGTTYYYKVIAKGAAANADSAYSAVVSGKIGQLAAPTVTLTNDAATGKIVVNWKAVSGAAKYEVYRATSKTGTYSKILTTTELTCLNKLNATPGTVYYYKVRALDASGTAGEYSAPQYRCVDCARPVLTLSNVASSGKVKITWAAVEGATKYEVYRATSANGTYTKILTTTSLSCTNTVNATPGTIYYYKVKALGTASNADSAFSEAAYRCVDCPQPVVTVSLNSSGKPVVKWNAVEGATKYEVYRATSASGTYTKILTTTNLSCTNTLNVVSGTTYYYKVIARGTASNSDSAYSAVVSIKAK